MRLYLLLTYLLLPAAFLRLGWRGLREPGYWKHWGERLGSLDSKLDHPVWIHAVSVGEVNAAAPLVQALHGKGVPILMTTSTPTGRVRAGQLFGDTVELAFLPYDLPLLVRRFLRHVEPRIGIVMESEIWPSLFVSAAQAEVPLVIANARLSGRSMRGYRRVKAFTSDVLSCVALVLAQSDADAARYRELGAARVEIVGDLKLDIRIPDSEAPRALHWREALGPERYIVAAGSTHAGEEATIIDALARLRVVDEDALLLLAPRHPRRAREVAALLDDRGLVFRRLSEADALRPDLDVLLLDTIGDLGTAWCCCDVAFVGGTLVPVGGHNLFEPAARGKPVLAGPHVFKQQRAADALAAGGGLTLVENAEQLGSHWLTLRNPRERESRASAGTAIFESARGALGRSLELIDPFLRDGARRPSRT